MISMAFKPVKLTDPKGKLPDVTADNAVDLSNFKFRDGYVPAKSQAGVDSGSAKPAGKATGADGKTVATA